MPPRKRKATVIEAKDPAPSKGIKTRKMTKDSPKEDERSASDNQGLEPPPVRKSLFANEATCNYWLMKSEPNRRLVKNVDISFSIDALQAADDETAEWDGVRSMEACNNLLSMNVGDLALFYHSNCRTPAVVGIMEIVRSAYPDQSQFDGLGPFFDRKSSVADPKWFSVDVKFVRRFQKEIPMTELRRYQDTDLSGMPLFSRPRLSIQSLTKQQFDFILQLDLGNKPAGSSQ